MDNIKSSLFPYNENFEVRGSSLTFSLNVLVYIYDEDLSNLRYSFV